ncbi:MAG: sigma-70 family RNA polymerase sigma factor [Desulfobacterales bacterium]|nr:sigma-70 family RNA polymerase sigma factor [Desulfobacterales bacterium]
MSAYRGHIERVLAGNKNAFAEIVAMFTDMALSMAETRLGNFNLAEDAVQEAFLAAFTELRQLRDPDAFPGWFRTILSRVCSRILRQRREEPLDTAYLNLPADEGANPYRLYTRYLDQAMIRRILERLPGVAREACMQRYVLGRSYREIASLLQVPEGTIKRRLRDARRRIIKEVQIQRGQAIRVGYMPISDHLLAMVSHARHDRPEQGIVLMRYLSWSGLARDLSSGFVDGAFIMAPMAMSLYNTGVPLIYILDGHHDGSAITVHRDMTATKLADLRIGIPHALSTHSMYLNGLAGLGKYPDVDPSRTRYISPPYLSRYFNGRKIDAFFCAEPWHTKFEVEGQGRVLARSGDFAPGHVCCILVVREPFAAHSGQLLRDYVAGLLAAAEYAASHPDECAAIHARYTGVSKDIARHILQRGYVTFHDLSPNKGRLKEAMDLALDSNVLAKPCQLDGFLRTEFA